MLATIRRFIRHPCRFIRWKMISHRLRKKESRIGFSILMPNYIGDNVRLFDGNFERAVIEDNVTIFSGTFNDSTIGKGTYAVGGYFPKSTIGKYCSIAFGSMVISGSHPTNLVSTYPGFYNVPEKWIEHFSTPFHFKNPPTTINGKFLEIGNDVWIGQNATFMPGLRIGDGSIVGAGALVTKDVPPYAIVGGVPARIIRYRFSEDLISFLLALKWWDWPHDKINKYAEFFDSPSRLQNAIRDHETK